MVVYKVFYKSYELRKGEFVGILLERRKDLRGKTRLESGLRWARVSFADSVKDRHAIFAVPDELELGSDPQWMIERGVSKEELLRVMDLADQETKRKEDGGLSSDIRRRPILRQATGGREQKGAAIRMRQNPQ